MFVKTYEEINENIKKEKLIYTFKKHSLNSRRIQYQLVSPLVTLRKINDTIGQALASFQISLLIYGND